MLQVYLNKYKSKALDLFYFSDEKQLELDLINIEYNSRMRSTLGRAIYSKYLIEINPNLIDKYPYELESVIVHELAHHLARILFKCRGHGREWKHIMLKLGFEPTRCHELDTSEFSRKHKPIAIARCNCRPVIEIKTKRYNNMIRGTVYRCKLCKTKLELVKDRE